SNWVVVAENLESSGISVDVESYNITPSEAKHVRIIGHGTSSNAWNMISEASL
ncbi:unnamed protein product, partial [Laminaria digitata]